LIKLLKGGVDMAGNVPVGVKIISVLYYIGAVVLILLGILLIVGAGFIGTILQSIPLLGALGAGLFIVIGIILIVFAVLSFFLGRGLWKAQKWARIVVIVFSVLGVLFALLAIVQGQILNNLLSLIINAVIGGYLLFSKDVKAAFS